MPNIRQLINLYYYRKKIPVTDAPVSLYASMINENKAFSFSRFGDGEWAAILGDSGKNCDGHEYFPEMRDKLRESITKPSGAYFFGMQNYAIKQVGRLIYRFIRKNKVAVSWCQSDVFHHANIQGRLYPFIEAIRKKEIVLVGPGYLHSIDKSLVNYSRLIEVPIVNCFLSIDEIKDKILNHAAKSSGAVYALSASMTTNCIIHDLFPEIGKKAWMLDLGSLWDGYLAAGTRSFCSAYDWKRLLALNTGG